MAYDDELLITALVMEPTQRQAAERVGCDRHTLQRRMSDPQFAAKVKAAKMAYMKTTTAASAARYELATDALVDILQNSYNDHLRLRAAAEILKHL